jgi:hypothetical protein
MTNHEYSGSLTNCLICYRERSEHVHDLNHLDTLPPATATAVAPSPSPSPSGATAPATCPGHQCPQCKKQWNHQYCCGVIVEAVEASMSVSKFGYCTECAQQITSEINRPAHIQELAAKDTDIIDARRQKELALEHKDFLVLHICKLPDGTDNPEWPAQMQAHIQNMREMQLKFRIYESAAREVRTDQEVQDLNKLTEEQKEQYLRDAKRNKVEHKEKQSKQPKESKPESIAAAILKSAMLLMKLHPKWSLERASEEARKMSEE